MLGRMGDRDGRDRERRAGAGRGADCLRGGSGTPLLLLHSGSCSWREWRAATPYLIAGRDVIAPTLPGGYGRPPLDLRRRSLLEEMADYVEQLLDDAGWSEAVAIAGGSHGALTALELHARGRAASVVALAPPWMSLTTAWPYGPLFGLGSIALRSAWPLHERTARWPRAGSLLLHSSLTPAALSAEDVVATLEGVRRLPLLRLASHGLRQPLLPDFERIHCPVTLVWGTRDTLAPLWMSRR
jgi:pimeloyl-ACP methyl ester carboxylesterase